MNIDEKLWGNFYGKQNIIVQAGTLSGKTENAIKRYKYLIEKEKIGSHEILVLVQNRQAASIWKKKLNLEYHGKLRIQSYFGFIQNEIKRYWPEILEQVKGINVFKLEPIFMNFESSQSLMTKTIEYYRNKNRLKGVVAEDEKLAVKFHSNIVKTSLAGLNYNQSGKRLAMLNPESAEMYNDMNIINKKYIEKSLEKGVLDYATTIYLYNKYLLKNKNYTRNLKKTIKTLIVDNFELADRSLCKFIEIIVKDIECSRLYYNTDGKYSFYMQGKEAIQKIFNKFKIVKIENDSNRFDEFSKVIKEGILYNKNSNKTISNIKFKSFEYKDEVYKSIILIIEEALLKKKTVAILTPINDIILEYILKKHLKTKGLNLNVLARKNRILDEKNTYTLFIMAELVYSYKEFRLNEDDLQNFFEFLFRENPIKLKLFIKRVFDFSNQNFREFTYSDREFNSRIGIRIIKKYENFYEKLKKYKEKKSDIDIILSDFYYDFLLKDIEENEGKLSCKNLIDLASNFVEVISSFDVIKDYNYEFIKFIKQGAKAAETLYDLEEKLENNSFILSTPAKYLASDKKNDIQIWLDLNSLYWDMNYINEFENPLIYFEDFDGEYDYEKELRLKLENIINTSTRIIKRADDMIYFFTREIDESYESSIIYQTLQRIEKNNENKL